MISPNITLLNVSSQNARLFPGVPTPIPGNSTSNKVSEFIKTPILSKIEPEVKSIRRHVCTHPYITASILLVVSLATVFVIVHIKKCLLSKRLNDTFGRSLEELRSIIKEKNTCRKAIGGKTAVYLHQDDKGAVAIKIINTKDAKERLQNKADARKLLTSSKRITIPKALYLEKEQVMLEEKFEGSGSIYANISTYSENPDAFDQAVCEMTDFFSKGYLSDLISLPYYKGYPLGKLGISDTDAFPIPRYDNMLLATEIMNGELVGKIGLIDLEHFTKGHNKDSLKTLVSIFPKHVDLILRRAAQLKKNTPNLWGIINKIELMKIARKYDHGLLVTYTNYKKWLTDTKKTPHTLQIKPTNTIITKSVKDVLDEYQLIAPGNETPSLFSDLTIILLDHVNLLAKEKEKALGVEQESWALLENRVVTLNTQEHTEIFHLLTTRLGKEGVEFSGMFFKVSGQNGQEHEAKVICDHIFIRVLKDLKQGNLIYSFFPKTDKPRHYLEGVFPFIIRM
jgi:hypothetical protein